MKMFLPILAGLILCSFFGVDLTHAGQPKPKPKICCSVNGTRGPQPCCEGLLRCNDTPFLPGMCQASCGKDVNGKDVPSKKETPPPNCLPSGVFATGGSSGGSTGGSTCAGLNTYADSKACCAGLKACRTCFSFLPAKCVPTCEVGNGTESPEEFASLCKAKYPGTN